MTDVASAILARMAGDDGWLMGKVTAIDSVTNSLTVAFPAGSVSGLRWMTSYTPAVNDLVAAARISGAWFVIGKTSAVMTAATVRGWSAEIVPWLASKRDGMSWTWWWYLMPQQGYWGGGGNTYGGYLLTPDIATAIPSGVTVQSAKLSIVRASRDLDEGPSLVSPVIYGTTGGTSGAPSLAAGYGPWRPGKLTYGQVGTWDLPSTWLAALRAGTLSGLAFYSTSVTELAQWSSASLSGTYTL